MFVPVAVETLGPICSVGEEFVTELGLRIANVSADPRDTAFFVSNDFFSDSEGQCCSCIGSSEVGLRLKLKYRSSRRYWAVSMTVVSVPRQANYILYIYIYIYIYILYIYIYIYNFTILLDYRLY